MQVRSPKRGWVRALAILVLFAGGSYWLQQLRPALLDPPRLVLTTPPRPLPELRFVDRAGRPVPWQRFRGKLVVLNIWATWCPPCRDEMPALDALSAALGSERFEIAAVSTDAGGPGMVESYFRRWDIRRLEIYVDPSNEIVSRLGVVGLPTTILVDAEGREIGRMTGPADWDSDEARALIAPFLPRG